MRRTVEQKINLINEILENKDFICGDEKLDKAKIIHIRNTSWTNLCTKRAELVKNLYTFAYPSSGYAIMINKIEVNGTYKDERLCFTIRFIDEFSHVNIGCKTYIYLAGEDIYIKIHYQPFCNPITPMHLLEDYGSDVLLATNLETQNLDDSFADIISVSNIEFDKILYNHAIKGASYLELLTNRTVYDLQCGIADGRINNWIRPIIETNEDEIWVKNKQKDYYEKVTNEYFNSNKSKYSNYYPVISYNEIKELNLTYQKAKKDIGCFGLGSAGTAILDLLMRCNYFSSLLLVDYDCVEEKNLRNQWYCGRDIGAMKCTASNNIINQMTRNKATIDSIYGKIETVEFDSYSFKYVISGFDNLEAREYVYEAISKGWIKTDYLIDCRYLDLSCSVYFIDTKDEEQMNYYLRQLEADKKLMKDEKPQENTCIKQNLIDIYKYVGAIVMGAVRLIENDSKKPYTHVEAETNVEGLPACMVVRR